MDLGLIGLAAALAAGVAGLIKWNRARESRAEASWAHAATRFALTEGPTERRTLRGHVRGVAIEVLSVERHVEQASLPETVVRARCCIVQTPGFHLAGHRSRDRGSPHPDAELDGDLASTHWLWTAEPRAIQHLLTADHRRRLSSIGEYGSLRCSRGVIAATLPDGLLNPERLEHMVALVASVAAVGADLRDALLSLEGLVERADTSPGLTIREIAQELGQLMAVLGGAEPDALQPSVYELSVERATLAIHLTYWRGAPGLAVSTPTTGELPSFSLRWDETGRRHGEPPDGITIERFSEREALLKHDGSTLRLFVRGPLDPPELRRLAERMASLASQAPSEGPFR